MGEILDLSMEELSWGRVNGSSAAKPCEYLLTPIISFIKGNFTDYSSHFRY